MSPTSLETTTNKELLNPFENGLFRQQSDAPSIIIAPQILSDFDTSKKQQQSAKTHKIHRRQQDQLSSDEELLTHMLQDI